MQPIADDNLAALSGSLKNGDMVIEMSTTATVITEDARSSQQDLHSPEKQFEREHGQDGGRGGAGLSGGSNGLAGSSRPSQDGMDEHDDLPGLQQFQDALNQEHQEMQLLQQQQQQQPKSFLPQRSESLTELRSTVGGTPRSCITDPWAPGGEDPELGPRTEIVGGVGRTQSKQGKQHKRKISTGWGRKESSPV